jgi:hypothetical protein
MIRILDLTSDSYLIPSGDGVKLDHVPIGPPVNPWPEDKNVPRGKLLHVLVRLVAARFGAYNWVMLPPVHVGWTVSNGWLQRSIKRCIRGLAEQPWLCRLVRRLVFGNACQYAICDASDLDYPSQEFARLSGAKVYFKRNLLVKESPGEMPEWHPLPMPVPDAWLDEAKREAPVKDMDFFSAGAYNSAERNELLEVGRELIAKSWKADLLEERVTSPEFWKRIARSRVCAAAQGCGYHSWRMFEAAGLGSVPIVNRPPAGLWSWFVDGENCLFMEEDRVATVTKIEALLRDPGKIETIAANARYQVNSWHRRSAITSRILDILKRVGVS